MESDFIQLCMDGDLLGAQRLFQLYPDINISEENDMAFRCACEYGHLKVAKWLLQQKPDINISALNEYALRYVCGSYDGYDGYAVIGVVKWLLQVKPDINISAENEEAFRWACSNGYLHVAQLLLQVKPDINISVGNECAFRWAFANGHLRVCQWLQSLKPYLYVINYDENGKIKGYRIREKEEANWEKRKYLVWLASNECPEENKNNLLYKLPSDVSRMVIGFV